MTIKIPKLSLVVLMGPSGSGKSTFAAKHFLPTEIVSSDRCRALVGDDELDQSVTTEAFEVLHTIVARRLAIGRLTVVDATNVQKEARRPLVELARQHHVLPVAVIMLMPLPLCLERHEKRTDRKFGPHVIRNQLRELKQSIGRLKLEGFRHIFVLREQEQVERATIEREPLWNDRSWDHGPFDFIGDVHGCATELEALLVRLGYGVQGTGEGPLAGPVYTHPEGRKAVFVGDLVDRGPRVLDTLRIVSHMVRAGSGLCVPGNHDMKFLKKLQGKNVQMTHGLEQSWAEVEALSPEQKGPVCESLIAFLDGLISHYVLDAGRLVVAHAGMKQSMQGRASQKVRNFALFGETTGETDEFGLPVRCNWAADYRGKATVVYGHTPVPSPEWFNNTINIDTGCVFGGKLTALRYPERELVSVNAETTYCQPARPLVGSSSSLTAQQEYDDVLDAADVIGKRFIQTRLGKTVKVNEENAAAALEVMSRFAVDPHWLIYLPPTMSPCETSQAPGYLEHPEQALAYFETHGVQRVVCEEKHMGSRAIAIVCKDEPTARKRFGITTGETGVIYTRTGRRFFTDLTLEAAFLERLRNAATAAGWWSKLETNWFCLDAELMPWSAKAQDLLQKQYAAVGAAGGASLPGAIASLEAFQSWNPQGASADFQQLLELEQARLENLRRYIEAYRGYCWRVDSLDDYTLAPFHLLATEGKVHTTQTHEWHMETLRGLCQEDTSLLLATPYRIVDLSRSEDRTAAVDWWIDLTAKGGEGMVVKPLDFIATGARGLIQPAVKCRGKEYLRIIYGPDYDLQANLVRLRQRGLGAKRALAEKEFVLGVEALHRFVLGEPLRRVHECVFGVLALETEPIDPRL